MKVIRILVYEGEEPWVRDSLGKANRLVQGVYTAYEGTIKEYYIQESFTLPTESPFDIEAEEAK